MKKEIRIGNIAIGANHPIAIQSMTNTSSKDLEATLQQVKDLAGAGALLVRISVNNEDSVKNFAAIKRELDIPLIADIHFHEKMAILALEAGADKIRINPGNMKQDSLERIIHKAKEKKVPIRIGVNSGSVHSSYYQKYADPIDAMFYSLKDSITFFEERGFRDLVLSAKSSDVLTNIRLNRLLDKNFDYPIHLGVTEAGTYETAVIKSAIGIGSLLADGIGNTIRVSITGDPMQEIPVAKNILKSLKLRKGLDLVSCPTCARCDLDLEEIANEVLRRVDADKDVQLAIMGCAVNGPGEARHADIGIAGSGDECIIFKKGSVVKRAKRKEAIEYLVNTINDEVE